MNGFEIARERAPVRIFDSPPGDETNPIALRIYDPDLNGWQCFAMQLNYVRDDGDITVEQGYYFRVHGQWSLPKNADDISGLFASLMWQTARDVDQEVRRRGAKTTHTFEWLLDQCRKGLKTMTWPQTAGASAQTE